MPTVLTVTCNSLDISSYFLFLLFNISYVCTLIDWAIDILLSFCLFVVFCFLWSVYFFLFCFCVSFVIFLFYYYYFFYFFWGGMSVSTAYYTIRTSLIVCPLLTTQLEPVYYCVPLLTTQLEPVQYCVPCLLHN